MARCRLRQNRRRAEGGRPGCDIAGVVRGFYPTYVIAPSPGGRRPRAVPRPTFESAANGFRHLPHVRANLNLMVTGDWLRWVPLVLTAGLSGSLVAGALVLWAAYGSRVFFEMIAAGFRACF